MKKNLIFLCLLVVFTGLLVYGYGYDVHDEFSRDSYMNKIVYENSRYVDSSDVASDLVDINSEKVILTVSLNYSRNVADMVPSLSSTDAIGNVYNPDHKEHYKAYHTTMNNEKIKNIKISDYDSLYISTLTPFVEYTYTLWKFDQNKENILKTLASNADVQTVYVQYISENKFVDSMYSGASIAGAEDVVLDRTYTGEGVKVGILENGIIDTTHANFSGISVTIHNQADFTETVSEHATQVASIIGGNNGLANEVTFLSSQINGAICEEVDWLINQGADIINCSFNEENPTGVYGASSAYVDYAARVYNQIFITSAGNKVGESNYYVSNPGLAYNAITVGAINTSKNRIDTSCYQVSSGPIKPTIMAKGHSLYIPGITDTYYTGTSYSCAMVTGMTALILERFPALVNNPMKLISLVTANAQRSNTTTYYYDMDNNFDEFMGAGEFHYTRICNNYVNSIDISHSTTAASSVVYRQEFTLNAGETLQASIAWFSYSEEEEVTSERTDYDIRLMYNNIVYSMGGTLYNNVEMVNFTATEDNSECAIIIIQHSTQVLQTETIAYSYNIT